MKGVGRIGGMACGLLVAAVAIDSLFSGQILSQKAVAIIGRPATPGSVAGVTRRTTRRVIRRSSIYLSTLPVGYTRVVVEGTSLFYYNGTTIRLMTIGMSSCMLTGALSRKILRSL